MIIFQHLHKTKVDSLPEFPQTAVQSDTEAFLTSEIETGSGEPRPSGRPYYFATPFFIKIAIRFSQLFKNKAEVASKR